MRNHRIPPKQEFHQRSVVGWWNHSGGSIDKVTIHITYTRIIVVANKHDTVHYYHLDGSHIEMRSTRTFIGGLYCFAL